jgi:hypothetical protein
MAQVQIYDGSAFAPIDAGWQEHWLEDFEAGRLKDAMWESPHLRADIVAALLRDARGREPALMTDFVGRQAVDSFLARPTEEQFRRAGLFWFATSFAPKLVHREDRRAVDFLTRQEMLEMVSAARRFKGHRGLGLSCEADLVQAGMDCCAAWFDSLPAPVSRRLNLLLPPYFLTDDDPLRSMAVEKMLESADLDLLEDA